MSREEGSLVSRIAPALLVVLACPLTAWGDRISEMPPTERCVYKARLAVAGYHHYLQGRERGAVQIHWHGDETQNEIDFVTRTLDEAYARAEVLERGAQDNRMSETQFGDQFYEACMSGSES
jgi:hypothetical protein